TRALRTLQNVADGVFVFGTAGVLAEWWRDERLVVLRDEYVSDPATLAVHLASTLVHEATHAWLERLGLEYTKDRRARIESICFRRQLRFTRRVPGGGEFIHTLEQQLARDPEYLTDDAFKRRLIEELQRLGVPVWVISTMDRWGRRWYRLRHWSQR